jgi:hypothetical protein
LAAKVDSILSYISKQNIDNVPLQDLVGNNTENVDVNNIRNFGNNGYENNNNNFYGRLSYSQNKYGSLPFIPYPNTDETQNKWEFAIDNMENNKSQIKILVNK